MARIAGVHHLNTLTFLRELSFAASIGLRFLFFWIFVSEPPRGELPPLPIPDDRRLNFITLDSDSVFHSAHWSRWSIPGFLLKWSLLAMTIGITVLQAIWRIVPYLRRYGTVYNIDGTLQIVVSSLYILKLLANTYMSPLTPRWKTLRDYSPIILALAISMGLGIGNILCCKFPNTTPLLLQLANLYQSSFQSPR
jgi:sulfur relay (sulfurtransferase) DsrC/TusE family protein